MNVRLKLLNVNCGGNHKASDNVCPKKVQTKQIIKKNIVENCSAHEARQQIKFDTKKKDDKINNTIMSGPTVEMIIKKTCALLIIFFTQTRNFTDPSKLQDYVTKASQKMFNIKLTPEYIESMTNIFATF